MNFGDKLKELRKSHNLTQRELAERLNVAKSVVSYYESGDRFPSYDVLIRISRTFHVTTDYLLGVERRRMIDVSGLSEENIDVVMGVVKALQKINH